MRWLHRTSISVVDRASPSTMAERFGLVFTNPDGSAVGNAEWILEPDTSLVDGQPTIYWIVTGDVVTLMDAAARAVVDAASEALQLDSISDELDQTQTILRAFAEVMLDQLNTLRAFHSLPAATLAQLKAAVRAKL